MICLPALYTLHHMVLRKVITLAASRANLGHHSAQVLLPISSSLVQYCHRNLPAHVAVYGPIRNKEGRISTQQLLRPRKEKLVVADVALRAYIFGAGLGNMSGTLAELSPERAERKLASVGPCIRFRRQ